MKSFNARRVNYESCDEVFQGTFLHFHEAVKYHIHFLKRSRKKVQCEVTSHFSFCIQIAVATRQFAVLIKMCRCSNYVDKHNHNHNHKLAVLFILSQKGLCCDRSERQFPLMSPNTRQDLQRTINSAPHSPCSPSLPTPPLVTQAAKHLIYIQRGTDLYLGRYTSLRHFMVVISVARRIPCNGPQPLFTKFSSYTAYKLYCLQSLNSFVK